VGGFELGKPVGGGGGLRDAACLMLFGIALLTDANAAMRAARSCHCVHEMISQSGLSISVTCAMLITQRHQASWSVRSCHGARSAARRRLDFSGRRKAAPGMPCRETQMLKLRVPVSQCLPAS
jgi:hypothetical protein